MNAAQGLSLALTLAACSAADSQPTVVTFPAEALTTATSADGRFIATVRTAPDEPPVHGTVVAELRLEDATTHAPIDGATVDVVPFMPAMGHGSSVVPSVTALGGGAYRIDRLGLFMPGAWELRLRSSMALQADDHATLRFVVR